jgi:hypothetical protein
MLDEGNVPENSETPEATPPEEKNNRTFFVVGGIMAGLVVLTLICMAVYFLVIAPRTTAQKNAAQATIEAENALAMQQLTATALAGQATATFTSSPMPSLTNTPLPALPTASSTPIINVMLNSPAATATNNPATLAAMQTQLSYQMTATAIARGMPATGFFDDIGLPTLLILAAALVVVIFLARRMRKAPVK